jgi:acyl-coenzyme A thioesterase PaaI-like protein
VSTPADELHVSPARLAAAEALRRLGHAVVGHQVDDAMLERIARGARDLLPEIESSPERARSVDDMKREIWENRPGQGGTIDHFPDCIVSGPANPMGIGITVHRDGNEAVARVRLGPAFEGAPGRAHGGVVAAIFDDTMGFVLTIHSVPAYTGRLTVSYLAPTPVGVELEFRARLMRRERRKLFIEGEACHDGERIAEGKGLFVAIPPERLGLKAPGGTGFPPNSDISR